ncbi:MAG: hypothetical protein ACOCQP_01125 [Lentisphaeria bacterium]
MTYDSQISGILPRLAVKAEHFPRSETGIGALMPWADRLWFVTYVAHKKGTGDGTGLFWIDDEMILHKHPASVVGTYANRMIHKETSQCIIGPHLIDTDGNVRTIEKLVDVRLTATCRHLELPADKVYFLGMEGEFFEVDVHSLDVRELADLKVELGMGQELPPHFKDAFSNHGRVFVANNSYFTSDFDRGESDGRLAEWDGRQWTVLERTQFNTVTGRLSGDISTAVFAVGQDRASAILRVFHPDRGWQKYRLPKATHTQDHAYTTEWPRIREIESERFMLNASGMFYELPPMTYAGGIWGVRPVCSHLRIIGDYCSWNGLLVAAGDQTTPIHDANPVVGQPQANLWFGKSDDLWQWGKPTGWGGPWWDNDISADIPSDPYLMTGFDKKCLHISHQADSPVEFTLEVDFRGDGQWCQYQTIEVESKGYVCHCFPDGFSAHWLRIIGNHACKATAQLHYT